MSPEQAFYEDALIANHMVCDDTRWDRLDPSDKDLIYRYFKAQENLDKPLLATCAKEMYIAYPVHSLFDEPTWALVSVCGNMNTTGRWLISKTMQGCKCNGYLLNKDCKHWQVITAFLGIASDTYPDAFGVCAFIGKDGVVNHVEVCPFTLYNKQLNLPSGVQKALTKLGFLGWLTWIKQKYTDGNTPHENQGDFIRLMMCGKVNLVYGGSVEGLHREFNETQVAEFVEGHKNKTVGMSVTQGDVISKDQVQQPGNKSTLKQYLKYKKPSETTFHVLDEVWRQCLFSLASNSNVMLTGSSGSGKTELCTYLAKQVGRPICVLNLGAMTEARMSLIGNVNYSPEKGTYFSESRFVRAITTKNTIVVLDELSRAPRDAFNILFPVLDSRRELAVDEAGDKVIKVAEGVCFIATANVGTEYTGTSAIDRALKDRFSQIEIDFPPKDNEIALLVARTGIPLKFAGYLVGIAGNQRMRANNDMEFVEQISTRMLLNAAQQYAFGLPFSECLRYAITGMFSGEGNEASDRFKINQIIATVVLKKDLVSSML